MSLMSQPNQHSTWDLSPVFDLLKSLRTSETDSRQRELPLHSRPNQIIKTDGAQNDSSDGVGLGNLDKLWDYLGVQRDVPAPAVLPFEASLGNPRHLKAGYTSDGAVSYTPSVKAVRWSDESESGELVETQPEGSPPNGSNHLTKSQRKKANKKAKQRAREASRLAAEEEQKRKRSVSDIGKKKKNYIAEISKTKKEAHKEREIGGNTANDEKENQGFESEASVVDVHTRSREISEQKIRAAREAVRDAVAAQVSRLEEEETRLESHHKAKKHARQTSHADDLATPIKAGKSKNYHASSAGEDADLSSSPDGPDLVTPMNDNLLLPASVTPRSAQNSHSRKKSFGVSSQPANHEATPRHTRSGKAWPVANPAAALEDYLSTGLRVNTFTLPKHTKRLDQNGGLQSYKTSTDRNWSLLLKLLRTFPEDRDSLLAPLQLSINRPSPNGIHVFVDASNIMIGFMEHLKVVRQIPSHERIPMVHLNFHALALLLERRRLVSKRVLAGSRPEVPAFEDARQVGYETCILDKVWKARDLTERQRRYEARQHGYTSASDSAANGYASGSGGTAPHPKWVEQAVDEILHLKILESVIDTPAPAHDASAEDTTPRPTMVLATGDAAEAEYSPGFMKMVQRALGKGWNVELMAWGKSISMEYRRMERTSLARGGWGERFKVIELDEFTAELFGDDALDV